jgi:chemotaxis protein MotB
MITISSWRWAAILLGVLLVTGCVSTKKYDASLAEIDSLKGDVKALDEKVKALEGENTELNSKLTSLNEELVGLNDDKKALEEERAALIRKIADLEHSLEVGKLQLTKEVTDLKEELMKRDIMVDGLRGEIATKDEQFARVIEERDQLQVELDKLYEQKRQAELAKKKAVEELKGTYEELVTELKNELKEGEVTITHLKGKLSLSMVDKILFDSGSAVVKSDGRKVLNRVAEILKKVKDKQFRVEGHTDDKPIGPKLMKKFPSNWELSSQRANNVVRYLQDEGGIDATMLSVAAYSMYRPVASNETKEGRAKNRRIEIVLVPLDKEKETAEEE